MMVGYNSVFGELRKRYFRPRTQSGRTLAVAALVLALAWGPGAQAAALKSISLDEYRAQVTRLQGVVAACSTSAAACDAGSVGNDVRVGDVAKGGFEQHWQWLQAALTNARSAKAEERATLVREAQGRLAELAQESSVATGAEQEQEFNRARKEANGVLARGEFQRGVGPTWWDRLKARALGWLGRFFTGVAAVGIAAPWLGRLLEWLFFVGAAVGLLFFMLRNAARQRLRISLGDAALRGTAWDREANDWAEQAEQHAAAGEWREAMHCLYWAAIVALEERRAWRHNPTRTPREYVRLLKPGTAQEQGLRRLTQIFERVWYGLRDANAEEYAEARSMYEGLAARATVPEESRSEMLSARGVS
jgi:hypothetical protein